MTHWTPMTVAPKSRWSAGSATFTTVPSIKARLEPRIVAASTHLPDDSGHGLGESPDRITPSSHGSRINVVILAYTLCASKMGRPGSRGGPILSPRLKLIRPARTSRAQTFKVFTHANFTSAVERYAPHFCRYEWEAALD